MGRLLWLVRHAQPPGAQGLCYGRHDLPADEAQTRSVARGLDEVLPPGIHVRVSPLGRCRQLARALEALRPGLSAAFDPRLAEMDFGAWENRPWDEIPRGEIDAWTADFPGFRAGGSGETVAEVFARVAAALQDARATPGGEAWITHAGVIRAAGRVLLRGDASAPAAAGDWPRSGPRWGEWQVMALE
ncbi:MAG: histidine phosphatase family protein [Burkholderiaceae bacterium]